MKTTLSEVEIKYYRKNIENQVESVEIERLNQKIKAPGHEDTLEILERIRDKLQDAHDSWGKIKGIFYPIEGPSK